MQGGFSNPLTEIPDGSVTTVMLADLSVTTAKIANLAVGTAQIANLAVGTAQIANAAITDAKIGSLSADKITTGTLSATMTITGGKIRTAATGQRVELTNGLDFYSTTNIGSIFLNGAIFTMAAFDLTGGVTLITQTGSFGRVDLQGSGNTLRVGFTGIECIGTGIYVPFGSATVPTHTFSSDVDTGLYRAAADSLGISAGGVECAKFQNGRLLVPAGSNSINAIAVNTNGNTGVYFPTGTQIALAIGGVQEVLLGSTGFNVPNVFSATTAGGANVNVVSTGQLQRSTSSKRYKRNIKSWVSDLVSVTLCPVMFDGLNVYQRKPGGRRTITETGTRHLGLLAEDVAKALPVASIVDEKGRPDAIDWNAITAALINDIRVLDKRLVALGG